MNAFPTVNYKQPGGEHGVSVMVIEGGMTLRDYFAAKAMQGNLASIFEGQSYDPGVGAAWAYEVADAMIEARGK